MKNQTRSRDHKKTESKHIVAEHINATGVFPECDPEEFLSFIDSRTSCMKIVEYRLLTE